LSRNSPGGSAPDHPAADAREIIEVLNARRHRFSWRLTRRAPPRSISPTRYPLMQNSYLVRVDSPIQKLPKPIEPACGSAECKANRRWST
jgi:hypothetical protein